MATRWMMTATTLGLWAAFAGCAAGEVMIGSGGSGAGGATSTSTSHSSTVVTTTSTGGAGGAGGATSSTTSTTTGTTKLCGNGTIDPGEQCDGNDFGGKTY